MRRRDDGCLEAVAGPDLLTLRTPIELRPDDMTYVGAFTVSASETIDFTLSYGLSYHEAPRPIDPHKALEQTESIWRLGAAARKRRALVRGGTRSLVTLRALIFQPSGGIVAAPTTSCPSNWAGRAIGITASAGFATPLSL